MGGGILEPKIDAYGGEHAVFEAVIGVSAHKCGFADGGLSKEANFEYVVVVPLHLAVRLISLYEEVYIRRNLLITVGPPAIGIAISSEVSTRRVPSGQITATTTLLRGGWGRG